MTSREIVQEEADRAGVTVQWLLVGRGPASAVAVRRVCAMRMRAELKLSYHQIGLALGGRDHTTVMNYFWGPEHRQRGRDRAAKAKAARLEAEEKRRLRAERLATPRGHTLLGGLGSDE